MPWTAKMPALILPRKGGLCSMLPQRMMMAAGAGGEVAFPDGISGLEYRFRADLGVTRDGSDFVSQWDDQAGVEPRHLKNANSGKQPVWSATSGPNGQAAITFDGSNDYLITDVWSTAIVDQPATIFGVFKFNTWTRYERFVTTKTPANSLVIDQDDVSPKIGFVAGAYSCQDGNAALGTFNLHVGYFSGASSTHTVNDHLPTTGNPGTGNGDYKQLVMGIDDNLVNLAADLVVAEVFLYNKAITGSDLTDLKSYINSRYAMW